MQKNKDYFIEQYSHEAITVSVNANVPPQSKFIADLRLFSVTRQLPQLPRMDLMSAILTLQQLGSDYIDVGFHTDWIAAEIPIDRQLSVTQFDKIIECLSAIKEKIATQK